MDDEALLVSITYLKNDIGVMEEQRIMRRIWASQQSVSRAEFFRAGQNGLQPALVLTTSSVNYDGEGELIWHGKRYAIYRTYQPADSDEIELYLQPKAGVTHGQPDPN